MLSNRGSEVWAPRKRKEASRMKGIEIVLNVFMAASLEWAYRSTC
jgi:hypothetical protein